MKACRFGSFFGRRLAGHATAVCAASRTAEEHDVALGCCHLFRKWMSGKISCSTRISSSSRSVPEECGERLTMSCEMCSATFSSWAQAKAASIFRAA